MQSNSHTIAIRDGAVVRKITKLIFGRDGSYMLLLPYHTSNRGVVFKTPVTYSQGLDEPQSVPFSDIADAGDVEERRVKLSHHRSGFLQFSGDGVVSGLDEEGRARGIAVNSWPLDNPPSGPSFGVTIFGLHDFKEAKPTEIAAINAEGIVFDKEELPPCIGSDGYALEGFYFPPGARRFLTFHQRRPLLRIAHPTGIIMELKVAVSDPAGCDFPGLVGFALYPVPVMHGEAKSGYMVSSSTGNLRKNDVGETVGDGLYCVFPDELAALPRRSLTFAKSASQATATKSPKGPRKE